MRVKWTLHSLLQQTFHPDWLCQALAALHFLNDLTVGQTLEGEGAEGDDLVEEDPVAPDVRHRSEYPVSETLRGHPPHGQHPATAEPVIVALEHLTGHPEVGQLDGSAGVDKTVPAGHVSVDISRIQRNILTQGSFSVLLFSPIISTITLILHRSNRPHLISNGRNKILEKLPRSLLFPNSIVLSIIIHDTSTRTLRRS